MPRGTASAPPSPPLSTELYCGAAVSEPLCFLHSYLITFVETGDPYEWRGYLYTFLLFALTIVRGIIQQQHFFGKFSTGVRIRGTLNAAVYRKVRLSTVLLAWRDSGKQGSPVIGPDGRASV